MSLEQSLLVLLLDQVIELFILVHHLLSRIFFKSMLLICDFRQLGKKLKSLVFEHVLRAVQLFQIVGLFGQVFLHFKALFFKHFHVFLHVYYFLVRLDYVLRGKAVELTLQT